MMRMTMALEEGEFHSTTDNIPAQLVKIWKGLFGLDGKLEHILNHLKSFMAHWSDSRGPEEYERDNKRDLENLLANAVREGARRANIDIQGSYHEGGGGQWGKWIMPGLVTLAVTGVIGNVIQYAEVASLKTAFTDFATSMERRVGNLEQRMYRGNP